MNFYVVVCQNIKKFDKYKKNNKIKSSKILNIKSLVDEKKIDPECEEDVMFFKLMVYKEIDSAISRKKNIYYIPYINNPNKEFDMKRLLNLKKFCKEDYKYNLIFFSNDLRESPLYNNVVEQMSKFDDLLIVEDY